MPEFLIKLQPRDADHAVARGFDPSVRDLRGAEFSSFDRVAHAGRAAEVAGFSGLVLPQHPDLDDPLILAAALARRSRQLLVVPEIDPAFATPVYAVKTAVTFQRFSGEALAWSLPLDAVESASDRHARGDFVEGEARYVRADEFLTVARGVWSSSPFSFEGDFFVVRDGGLADPLSRSSFPQVRVSGATPRAVDISARLADVHVWPWHARHDLSERIGALDEAAADHGRAVAHSLEVTVVARESDDEARASAPPEAQLVGSYESVAEALRAYADLGIEDFVLDVRPTIEEAYRLGQHLLPLLETTAASR